jgi:hypothetical protein
MSLGHARAAAAAEQRAFIVFGGQADRIHPAKAAGAERRHWAGGHRF